MLPADDLPLTPGDTLNTSQWEAWYPGEVQRRKPLEDRPDGSQLTRGPWYSWQDSYLEWPDWEGVVTRVVNKKFRLNSASAPRSCTRSWNAWSSGCARSARQHFDKEGKLVSGGYNAALQVSPPTLPNDLADFLKLPARRRSVRLGCAAAARAGRDLEPARPRARHTARAGTAR